MGTDGLWPAPEKINMGTDGLSEAMLPSSIRMESSIKSVCQRDLKSVNKISVILFRGLIGCL